MTTPVKDPFATLEIEPRFDIDVAALDARRKELVRALHPDRFASSPANERRMALGRSIEVNEAFRALRNPIKRAEALARKLDLPVGETSEPKPDPELLMEMMEAREDLAAAGRAKDTARLEALASQMREREKATLEGLTQAFRDPVRKETILPKLGELRYLRRFLDEAAAFQELAEAV